MSRTRTAITNYMFGGTKTRRQISAVLRSKEKDRLLQKFTDHPLADLIDGADTVFWTPAKIAEIAALKDDTAAYSALRTIFAQDNTMSSGDRADALADNLLHMVPKGFKPKSYLDYGCANGTITQRVAKKLNIPSSNVFGADIIDTGAHTGYTFIHLPTAPPQDVAATILAAIPDHSIDLITISMVLHHVVNIDGVMRELERVISPNGCIIIREHDCTTRAFAEFLDVLHGLYSLVWTDPVEDPTFVETYKAYYRSEPEWRALFHRYGFREIAKRYNPSRVDSRTKKANIPNRYTNVVQAFYAVYRPEPMFDW